MKILHNLKYIRKVSLEIKSAELSLLSKEIQDSRMKNFRSRKSIVFRFR